ncbi:LCP family protein [Streptomyces triticirhizae]|uniref:LytR family transcriptional regulator n=1 Tax=Streptomyces triticirhizae TaxID=2483353 RepID=A0A3M2LJI8_9ACTN|nr:LCP family protein [Streptomyces triticirhizae]RMI37296.1 LytR family transcriptional regulator [Streptomyces triticirhizae]
MSDWPDGWSDDDQDRGRYGRGRGSATPESARVMPHVNRPPRQRSPQHDSYAAPARPAGPGRDAGQAAGYDSGWNEGRVYRGAGQQPPPPDAPHPGPQGQGPGRPKPPPRWGRRIGFSALALVLVLTVVATATYFWADGKLNRDVDLEALEDRPEPGEGTNFLIVGSDSREGLSEEQRDELNTGNASGSRTDTIMILHVGSNGNTMVSLPRDSWVTIPEFTGSESGNRIPEQQQKINAAFSIEGPWLLARTIEYNLDIHIDHYVEIGFGGFANVVDALGGVEMCFDEPIQDENSGADFEAGCHQLNGAESLAFNRQRYQEAEGDLGRTRNQQNFLGTLASQAASPGTLLNPFRLYPTLNATVEALTVDTNMSLWDLRSMFWAMRGAERMNMPVADPGYAAPDGSSAVLWDEEQVDALMEQLRNDEEVTVGVEE